MTDPAVLITGTSTGIGAATVRFLDQRGYRVFAGVRREEDAARLRDSSSERVTPVFLDVTDRSMVTAAAELVERAAPHGLAGLVNNAAVSVPGPIEGIPLDEFRAQLEVNLVGVLAVTQALLPSIRRAGGRIVNVSSINGRVVTPFGTPYGTSKFGLEALSDGLRVELRRWKIHVSVIQPGAIDTPIWTTSLARAKGIAASLPPEVQELYRGIIAKIEGRAAAPPPHALAPERVARVIYRALTARRPKTRYLVGWDARLAAVMKALLPDRAMDRILGSRAKRR
ncbi:MAG: SDR family oxidoreductase [Gemmatimonadales bacterium]